MITELTIKAYWDNEALVWVAASGDVPGLIADAYTLEKLFTKLAILAPELLELNGVQEPHLKRIDECEALRAELDAARARIAELEMLLQDLAP